MKQPMKQPKDEIRVEESDCTCIHSDPMIQKAPGHEAFSARDCRVILPNGKKIWGDEFLRWAGY